MSRKLIGKKEFTNLVSRYKASVWERQIGPALLELPKSTLPLIAQTRYSKIVPDEK